MAPTQILRPLALRASRFPNLRALQTRLVSTAPSKTLQIGGREVSVPTGLFINNEFRKSIGGNVFPVENPGTGKEAVSIEEGRAEDVDEAVKVARTAFEDGNWSSRVADPAQRGVLLNRLAQLMERDKEDLVALEMLHSGKTYRQAAYVDFPASVAALKYYAGWADKIQGLSSFNIPGAFAYTRREPMGVVGQITPFNFPLIMFTWKIAPAIAAGNTVVIKSAESTPLSALKVCELIKEAGFPAGTVNLISGYGKSAGDAIASHMGVDKVAFTGSTATGRAIMKSAAASNLKPVTLELGGKSPNIFFPDADLDKSVDWALWGINMNFGQTCHAGTRIYVHEDIYDQFLEKFAGRLSSIKVGDNFAEGTDMGPVNSKMQFDKIMGYINRGKEEGATVEIGGKEASVGQQGGYYIEPTIFTNTKPSMKIVQDEIFGPVVAVSKFKTEEEVLQLANDTTYGLAAAIHTKDYQRVIRMTNGLQAGVTWVNMYNMVHWAIPFGGYKQSGIGLECGEVVLEAYTQTKSVYLNMDIPAPAL